MDTTIALGDVEVIRVEKMHGPVGLTAEQFIPDVPAGGHAVAHGFPVR